MSMFGDLGSTFGLGGGGGFDFMLIGTTILYVVVFGGLAFAIWFFLIFRRQYRIQVNIKEYSGDNIVETFDKGKPLAVIDTIKLWRLKLEMPLFPNEYFYTNRKGHKVVDVAWDGLERFFPLKPPQVSFDARSTTFPGYTYNERAWVKQRKLAAKDRYTVESWMQAHLDKLLTMGMIIGVIVFFIFASKGINETYDIAHGATQDILDRAAQHEETLNKMLVEHGCGGIQQPVYDDDGNEQDNDGVQEMLPPLLGGG